MSPTLHLRDVHDGVAPPWWPLAPGWWLVLALVVAIAILFAWWTARRHRRRAALLRLFDDAVAQARTPSEQVAAMSEVLRRAARRKDPAADALDGDDWLHFLDAGMPQPVFSAGAGRLLRDGAFRSDVSAQAAEALRVVARERYQRWMQAA